MDNVTKVTFPAFSRMQDDRNSLTRSLERSIFFICALVYPSLIGLTLLFPVLISVIPKYQKWAPAFIPLILISFNSAIAAVTTQLTNLLTSVGKIKTTLKLMIMWTSLSWIFLPFLSKKWGVNGAALGYAIVGLSSFIVFYLIKKIVDWSILNSVIKPLVAASLMGAGLFFLKNILPYNILTLTALIATGAIIYGGLLYFLVGSSFFYDVKKGVKSIIGK
jgi:PST family polysaccharide transporter/lipopolysaccharide exporter